jgi:hypothetical protein
MSNIISTTSWVFEKINALYKPFRDGLFLSVLLLGFALPAGGQDTLLLEDRELSKLAFFLNDTYFVAGGGLAGIYHSNNYRQLRYAPGFEFGIEQYFPMQRKMFLSLGLHFAQRNFIHAVEGGEARFRNYYLDFPVNTSFELPILRQFDFRFILGAQAGVKLWSAQASDYPHSYTANGEGFAYSTKRFHGGDLGWNFGLSGEHRNLIVRLRSYTGFVKIDGSEQGMLNSFNFELGYFFLRNEKHISLWR